jgi:hypothetical protein
MRALAVLPLLILGISLGRAAESRAAVFHSKESALRLAFPDADHVEPQDLFLSEEEVRRVSQLAGAKQESRLVTAYVGRKDGEILGYAFFDTHTVRTLPETILIRLEPEGEVAAVHLLSFHEPLEYQAAPKWLEQFEERALDESLGIDRGIDGIAGSTLTARAITAAVRRTLAVYECKLAPAARPLEKREPAPR